MVKKAVVFLVLFCFLVTFGCLQNIGQIPSTPKGQAVLLIGAYHDQVTIYESDVRWAENEDHIRLLRGRLEAFKLADDYFDEIGAVVAAGGTIPEGLVLSTKNSLNELKRWLYSRQAIERTDAEVEAALVDAGVIPKIRTQGWESIVLLLIELVQSFAPMWDRLVGMNGWTPEQIDAEFQAQWLWKQSFDPYLLPEPAL